MSAKKIFSRFFIFTVIFSFLFIVGCEKEAKLSGSDAINITFSNGSFNAIFRVLDDAGENSIDLEVISKSESKLKSYLSNEFSIDMIRNDLDESKDMYLPTEETDSNKGNSNSEMDHLIVDEKDAINVYFKNVEFKEDVKGFKLILKPKKSSNENHSMKSKCHMGNWAYYYPMSACKPKVETYSCAAFVVVGSYSTLCQYPFYNWLDSEFMGSYSTFIADSYYSCPRVYVASNYSSNYSISYYLW